MRPVVVGVAISLVAIGWAVADYRWQRAKGHACGVSFIAQGLLLIGATTLVVLGIIGEVSN